MTVIDFTVPRKLDWISAAVCASADPEEWFPEGGATSNRAKRICQTCPVINECLQYALGNDMDGIWGGTSRRERVGLMRRAS